MNDPNRIAEESAAGTPSETTPGTPSSTAVETIPGL